MKLFFFKSQNIENQKKLNRSNYRGLPMRQLPNFDDDQSPQSHFGNWIGEPGSHDCRRDYLMQLINSADPIDLKAALLMVQGSLEFCCHYCNVNVVIHSLNAPQELVNATLESYINFPSHEDVWGKFASEVILPYLWKNRSEEWLKRFHERIFQKARTWGVDRYGWRIVDNFIDYARWDDDPADFQLTPENLCCIELPQVDRPGFNKYCRSRLAAAPFASEEAYLRWQLEQSHYYHVKLVQSIIGYRDYFNFYVVDGDRIRQLIKRLHDLGVDVSSFVGFEAHLHEQAHQRLQDMLNYHVASASDTDFGNRYREAIVLTMDKISKLRQTSHEFDPSKLATVRLQKDNFFFMFHPPLFQKGLFLLISKNPLPPYFF